MPSLDILIVNWNSGQLLRNCLQSFRRCERDDLTLSRVIIADNNSSDGSADNLDWSDIPITLIRNHENRGFAAACNMIAKNSRADYLLFLNPDTELYANSLNGPIQFLERPENQDICICGIQLLNDLGKPSRSCARFPKPAHYFIQMFGLNKLFPGKFESHLMDEWDHSESRVVDQVIGAFFLIRRTVFESLGGFDEGFFVYFEEADLSLRARRLGSRSYYLTSAQAYHKGGGTSDNVKAHRLFYSLSSRILYAYKHFSPWSATGLTLATICVEPFSRAGLGIGRGSWVEVRETAAGYAMLWAGLPALFRTISKLPKK